MEKNRRGKTSRFDNSHQIFFIPAQTGFRRHHNGPRKLFGLQKPKKPYADARKAAEIISRKAQAPHLRRRTYSNRNFFTGKNPENFPRLPLANQDWYRRRNR